MRAHTGGARLPPRDVSLLTDSVRVTGRLSSLYPEAQVVHRFGRSSARAELALWIKHLALLAAGGYGGPFQSVLIGRDRDKQREAIVRFDQVPDPGARLADLVRLYLLGQTIPLRFFPEASLAYAKLKASGKDDTAAREAAKGAFAPRAFGGGPPSAAEDPYIARVLDGRDPTDPDLRLVAVEGASSPDEPGFAELACAVFAPLLEHRSGEREERADARP